MRWTLRIAGLLALAWLVFLASPFVALHNFGREIEARDVEAVRHRINFRALRLSLLKQVLEAYAREKGRALEPGERQLAIEAAAALADPVIAPLLSAEAVIDLLDDGWPTSVAGPEDPASPLRRESIAAQLKVRSLAAAWPLFRSAELRGFRNVVVALPPGRARDAQFQLRLRLVRTTWKLVTIELPPALLQELMRKLPNPLRQGEAVRPAEPAAR